MTPEAEVLYAKLAKAQSALNAAKRDLEELRKLGEEATQVVTALRAEVHSLADQLKAQAASEVAASEATDG